MAAGRVARPGNTGGFSRSMVPVALLLALAVLPGGASALGAPGRRRAPPPRPAARQQQRPGDPPSYALPAHLPAHRPAHLPARLPAHLPAHLRAPPHPPLQAAPPSRRSRPTPTS
jgi:hypothetical protein